MIALLYGERGTAAFNAYFNLATGTVGTRGTQLLDRRHRERRQRLVSMLGFGALCCDGQCAFYPRCGSKCNGALHLSRRYYHLGRAGRKCHHGDDALDLPPDHDRRRSRPALRLRPGQTHAAKGLLIEEARTNIAYGSQDFTNATGSKPAAR